MRSELLLKLLQKYFFLSLVLVLKAQQICSDRRRRSAHEMLSAHYTEPRQDKGRFSPLLSGLLVLSADNAALLTSPHMRAAAQRAFGAGVRGCHWHWMEPHSECHLPPTGEPAPLAPFTRALVLTRTPADQNIYTIILELLMHTFNWVTC